MDSLANDPLHFQAFTMIIDKLRDRLKHKNRQAQGDDYIKKNKVLIKYWNQYEQERRKKQHESFKNNLQTALARKEMMLKYKREKLDIDRKLKQEHKEREKHKVKRQLMSVAWITHMQKHTILKRIHKKFEVRACQIRNQRTEESCRARLYYMYRTICKQRGPDLDTRLTRNMQW